LSLKEPIEIFIENLNDLKERAKYAYDEQMLDEAMDLNN
jgi:hypothetical protein